MSAVPSELVVANGRVNAAYASLPEPTRNALRIDGPQWCQREDAIDAAYVAGDEGAFREAVAAWEAFALSYFKLAAGR